MDTKTLRGMSKEALNSELTSLLKAQFNLRMQKATQQLQNTSELKKTRRSIARVKTILTELGGKHNA